MPDWKKPLRIFIPPRIPYTTDLLQARKDYFFNIWTNKEGWRCPCCERYGKVYVRHFGRSQALAMLWFLWQGTQDWVDPRQMPPKMLASCRDWTIARHWGLVEPLPAEDDPEGRKPGRSGFWRITDEGVAFAKGETRIYPKALLYAGDCYGYDEDARQVSLMECVGKKFDLQELMDETAAHPKPDRREP